MSDVAFTWSSSNETVGTVNASGLFTSLAPGITNVTASSGNVSASAEVTVIGPSPDLTISSVTSTTYPISYNKVTVTIRNEGTEDAGAFKTNFTVDGNTTSIEIPGLDAGNTTTISITDMVRRKSGDSIPIMSVRYTSASPELPTADFKADVTSGTTSLTVNFTDQSTGSPTSWLWDFGDGTNATEQNVSHTYTSAGNYTVNLTVANEEGNDSEVKTEYIIVSEPLSGVPVANFTANRTSGTAPLAVKFTDASTGTVSSYACKEIRSSVLYVEELKRIYFTSKGGYCYALGFNATDGTFDTSEKYIANIGYSTSTPAYYNGRIYVGASGIYCLEADLSKKIWHYAAGNVQSSPVISTYYDDGDGEVYIYFTVNGNPGGVFCLMTGLVSATVAIDAPVANFTANTTSGTAPLTVQFTDISANATSWAWDFNNDGTVDSTEQNPAYTYSKAGIYSVNLTVSNAGGSNSEVKTEYITVTSAATNDLSITGLVNTVPGSAVFAKESNTIKVLNIMRARHLTPHIAIASMVRMFSMLRPTSMQVVATLQS